jgi:hypothetical protein
MLQVLQRVGMSRPGRMETSSRRTPGSRAGGQGWMPASAGMTIAPSEGLSAFQRT